MATQPQRVAVSLPKLLNCRMPSSILYHLDRKTSNRLTVFLFVIVILGVIFGVLFKKKETPKLEQPQKVEVSSNQ